MHAQPSAADERIIRAASPAYRKVMCSMHDDDGRYIICRHENAAYRIIIFSACPRGAPGAALPAIVREILQISRRGAEAFRRESSSQPQYRRTRKIIADMRHAIFFMPEQPGAGIEARHFGALSARLKHNAGLPISL